MGKYCYKAILLGIYKAGNTSVPFILITVDHKRILSTGHIDSLKAKQAVEMNDKN